MAALISPYLVHGCPRELREAVDGCRRWQGTYDAKGYPRYKSRGRSRYVVRAVFQDFHRRLEPGERVYRVCRNRWCVNALHMVTERPAPKGKRRRPGTAKLNPRKVRSIREAWAATPRPTQAALAQRYGMSRSAISLVVRGVTWTDVPIPVAPVVVSAPAPVRLSAVDVLRSRMVRSGPT